LRTITTRAEDQQACSTIFFSGELSLDFYFLKTLATNSREKRGGYSLEIAYKRLEIVFFGEGVGTIMFTGCSFKSSFKDCRRLGEICLNLRRDVRYASSSLRQEIEKNETLAYSYWKCE